MQDETTYAEYLAAQKEQEQKEREAELARDQLSKESKAQIAAQSEKQAKYQRMCDLRSKLQSADSDIGDYRIIKTCEARLKGEDDPYDTDALLKKRQAVRDEINKLQEELAKEGDV